MNQRKAGALLSYLYLALTFVVGIFYTPILLGFLGKSEYGVYSVANSVIAFLAILDLGFSQTMIRYVQGAEGHDRGTETEWDVFTDVFRYRCHCPDSRDNTFL